METCIDDVLRAPVVPPVTTAEEAGASSTYVPPIVTGEDPLSLTGEPSESLENTLSETLKIYLRGCFRSRVSTYSLLNERLCSIENDFFFPFQKHQLV